MQVERGRGHTSIIVPGIVGVIVAGALSVGLLSCDLVDLLPDLHIVRRQIYDAIKEWHRQQLSAIAWSPETIS